MKCWPKLLLCSFISSDHPHLLNHHFILTLWSHIIMDLDTRSCYESEAMQASPPSNSGETKRLCRDCNTTRTPCWRSGPAGPRTLCNACGIRYRKKKRGVIGMEKGGGVTRSRSKIGKSGRSRIGVSLKMGLMGFGRDRVLVEDQDEWKRKLGEEERAAILLMALSASSSYA